MYSKQDFNGLCYKAILRLEVLRHGARSPNPATLLVTFYKPNGKQCGNQLMLCTVRWMATKHLSAKQCLFAMSGNVMLVENQIALCVYNGKIQLECSSLS